MNANADEQRRCGLRGIVAQVHLPLSQQLDNLPESDLVRKVREDFFRTGTCAFEDLCRILGHPSRAVRADDALDNS